MYTQDFIISDYHYMGFLFNMVAHPCSQGSVQANKLYGIKNDMGVSFCVATRIFRGRRGGGEEIT